MKFAPLTISRLFRLFLRFGDTRRLWRTSVMKAACCSPPCFWKTSREVVRTATLRPGLAHHLTATRPAASRQQLAAAADRCEGRESLPRRRRQPATSNRPAHDHHRGAAGGGGGHLFLTTQKGHAYPS